MKTTEENVLTAPCGIYCGECFAYKAKDNPAIIEAAVAKGIPRAKLPCPGCRVGKGDCPSLGCACATYECVDNRSLDFCFECPEFPCSKLIPAAHRANEIPHNIKIYNLCLIKEQGLAASKERASEINQKYFQGEMVLGEGPQLK